MDATATPWLLEQLQHLIIFLETPLPQMNIGTLLLLTVSFSLVILLINNRAFRR